VEPTNAKPDARLPPYSVTRCPEKRDPFNATPGEPIRLAQ